MFAFVFQERADVFQQFTVCPCGVLLCTVSVNIAATAEPCTPLQTADLCSPCVSGCSRSRSPPAAGHLDSAGTSRCLAVNHAVAVV